MVCISAYKNLGSSVLKSTIAAAKSIAPAAVDISKIRYSSGLSVDMAVFSTLKKAASNADFKKQFSSILNKYNQTKLAAAAKRGRTTQILNNWNNAYAVKNSKGVYQNAVDELTKQGGALDDYLKLVFPKINAQTEQNARRVLTQYLEKNLDIYSYERIEDILKGFAKQIQKSGKNPVVYVPSEEKSYGIISALYKKVNPDAKIITGWKNLTEYSAKNPNTNIAIFDDCIMSGKSVQDVYNSIRQSCKGIKDIDFYACTACEKGINQIKASVPQAGIHYDGALRKTLEESDFYKSLAIVIKGKEKKIQQDFLKTLLRCQDTSQGFSTGSAVMFPYMAPNNNSIFAANMIESLFSGPRFAIKNCEKVSVSKEGILEYPPKWLAAALK